MTIIKYDHPIAPRYFRNMTRRDIIWATTPEKAGRFKSEKDAKAYYDTYLRQYVLESNVRYINV